MITAVTLAIALWLPPTTCDPTAALADRLARAHSAWFAGIPIDDCHADTLVEAYEALRARP